MRITIRDNNLIQDLIVSLLVLSLGVAAAYMWLAQQKPTIALGLLGLGALTFVVATIVSHAHPLIQIDERGVFDRRLGIGRIDWSDIEGVQIQGGYGHRVLALRLARPERYAKRLTGRSRRIVAKRHELGFSNFNIDLRDVDLNLIDLKNLIEQRIS